MRSDSRWLAQSVATGHVASGSSEEATVASLLATLFVQPLIEEIERRGGLWL